MDRRKHRVCSSRCSDPYPKPVYDLDGYAFLTGREITMTLRKRTAQLLEYGHNDDRASQVLNLLLIALIALNVVATFMATVEPLHQRHEQAFFYFELFSVLVFTLEYLARVWSSIDQVEAGDTSPLRGRIKYMLSPIALVDLIAILPFYLSLYVVIDLRFLRVLRLIRLLKLTRYSPALGALLEVIRKESDALLAAFVVLLMMLVLSAGGIYLLENELQPEAFGSMPDSLWWAIVTLTTVGYGDVVPVTPMGKMFGGVIGLIGIGMIALPAAIMASGFADNIHASRQKYNRYIQRFLKDGVIDEKERWRLEALRKELGLDPEEALQVLNGVLQQLRHDTRGECPHCGQPLGAGQRDDTA
jgi:voltage-gated potassium channel